MNNFGVFLCQQEKYSVKLKLMFKNAINAKEYTRTASSYENLRRVQSYLHGEPEKAKQYFENALRYDPRRQSTLMELIDLAILENDYDSG